MQKSPKCVTESLHNNKGFHLDSISKRYVVELGSLLNSRAVGFIHTIDGNPT